jgi:DNA-binding SARP family transcriptional activator
LAVKLLKSKLLVPQPPRDAIERRRLIEAVEKANEAGIVMLIAPAGYGKTTVAQQILDRRTNAVKAWYHLDSSDSDTGRFLTYLVEALKRMLPDLAIDFGNSQTKQAVEDICFAIEQYEGPAVYLVLDNWECVDSNMEIASIPLLLARSGRGRLKLIIASRVPPSFKIRRAQSRGSVLLLDSSQLAFSLSECHDALKLRFGRGITDEIVERFWKETSGWCVSVGLLPASVSQSGFQTIGQSSFWRGQTDAFSDYFTEEVYDLLPSGFALFLCETSLFDVLTNERCAAVVSSPEKVGEFLEQLGQSAIPHVMLEQRGHYRLHALARQALRMRLQETVDADRFASLSRSTAECYLNEGAILEAINLLMEVGDSDPALELMNTKWAELYGQHGWKPVKQWLEAMPTEFHDRPAFIKTYSNVLNVSGNNKGAVAFLQDKLSPDRFSDDIEDFGSLWANYWWARINTEPGPHYDAIKKDHAALTAVARGFSPTMLGIFENTLGMAAHLELRLREALVHVHKAAELVEEPYERLRIIANQNCALYSHLLGESAAALNILKHAREDCHRLSLHSQLPKMYMLEANIHLGMGYYREALDDIDHCVAAMREFGGYSLQLDTYIGRFRGMALWHLGDRSESLRLLMAASDPAKEFGLLTGMEVALLYEYYTLLAGRRTQPVDVSHSPGGIPDSECSLIDLSLQAMKALLKSDNDALGRYATQIRDLAENHEMPQWAAAGSFLLAMSFTVSAESKRQIDLLRHGLANLKRIGWRSYPMANDLITSFVLAKAIRSDLDREMVDALLATGIEMDLTPAFDAELRDPNLTESESIRLWEAAVRLSIRGLSIAFKQRLSTAGLEEQPAFSKYRAFLDRCAPPPIRVEMLGGFSVSSKGRVIRFNRSSSRLLFQHLLLAYPGRVHEEELIEHIWPETDPAKGRGNLRTAVKDLRKSLDPYSEPRGSSYVAYSEEHYGLELPVESRIDYIKFLDLMQECLRKESSTNVTTVDRMAHFRQALDMYRGPLLPMLRYESFVIEERERLQALYQKGSLRLAELLIEARNPEAAASVIEMALEYDQLWTDGVRVLLQIHVMRGETLKAMRVYRGYEQRLQSELDLPPDEGIRRYFDEIVRSSVS